MTFDEYSHWRDLITEYFEEYDSRLYSYVYVINPSDYFNFEEKRHISEKEVMEFDLHKVRNSNLIIVNFNDPSSLGTQAELAVAYEHRIPIIGLNEKHVKLHPWQAEFCNRVFDDMDEMLDYVGKFYLD